MTWSSRAATGLAATFQNNIWCYLTSLNLLKYFISRDEELPANYIKKCEKFLDSIGPPKYYGGSNTGGRIFKVKKQQTSNELDKD